MSKLSHSIKLALPFTMLIVGMPLTATYGARGTGGNSNAVFVRLVDQEVRYLSRTDPTLPPARRIHISGTLVQHSGAAIVVAYPLRHPKTGCTGIGWMFAVRKGNQWVTEAPLQLRESCLSAKLPLDLHWAYTWSSRYRGDIVFGRTSPAIHTLRFSQRTGTSVIHITHSFFLISARCTSVKRVQAVDAQGRVIYETRLHGCIY